MSESPSSNDAYEMFWNCPACGTAELLGKTHRHCPACGSPQDASRRYFPPEDRKVLAADHVYAGADLVCANCETPNGARAAFCGNCGARIGDDDSQVAIKIDDAAAPTAPARPLAHRGPGRGRVAAILGVVALAVVAAVIALTWTHEQTFRVDGHRWQRIIDIETFSRVPQGQWCRSMPADAASVARSRRQSGTRQVAAGEDCRTTRVDQGDGTYREERACTTRYRTESVHDDWCDFTVDRWVATREARASGVSSTPAPRWPAPKVDGCAVLGCERLGSRREAYLIAMREEAQAGEVRECALAQPRWGLVARGSRWRADVGVVTGAVDCATLVEVSR